MPRAAHNTKKLYVWIPPKLASFIRGETRRMGVSTSEYVRNLIRNAAEKRDA